MTHANSILFALILTGGAAGCAPRAATTERAASPEVMTGDDEHPLPRTTVSEVMRSKLAHAQAVLEGITMNQRPQVRSNAQALRQISESGDWLVQESAAYFAFSAKFREACDALILRAESADVAALSRDYAALVNTCVACHEYLRREREVRDLPGRISFLSSNDLAALSMKGTR